MTPNSLSQTTFSSRKPIEFASLRAKVASWGERGVPTRAGAGLRCIDESPAQRQSALNVMERCGPEYAPRGDTRQLFSGQEQQTCDRSWRFSMEKLRSDRSNSFTGSAPPSRLASVAPSRRAARWTAATRVRVAPRVPVARRSVMGISANTGTLALEQF